MSLSIRATGLLAVLQRNPDMALDVDNLYTNFNETKQYIDHTLQELIDSNRVSIDLNKVTVIAPLEAPAPVDHDLESRIYSLYSKTEEYSVIAWFLSQLGHIFELDSELMLRVNNEYDAATVVKFWSPYHRDQAMKRAMVDKSKGNVTLDDLRELLVKKDKGEIVWQK